MIYLSNKKINIGKIGLLLLIIILGIMVVACNGQIPFWTAQPSPTFTPEPIVPTRTVAAVLNTRIPPTGTATPPPSAIPADTPTRMNTPEPDVPTRDLPTTIPESIFHPGLELADLERFGGTGGVPAVYDAFAKGLQIGVTLNWNVTEEVPEDGPQLWQMIRLEEEGIRRTTWDQIELTLAANPGSYWLIGNEPDVLWQDNVTPQRYAELYHEIYYFIKERDADAKVVIGGVSQPTPLRRAYLDIILETYQANYGEKMPIDIWNVHAFTLREERGSWGVDIPPGFDVDTGELYEIEDHDDLEIMRQNLIDFRAWMADHGYQDKPLVVSEYGILMPPDYGFPLEVVGDFLTGSFDLFLTEQNETGYPADDNHLVQWWFWYSVYDGELYPTGNLYDVPTGELTPLGDIWNAYIAELLGGS